MVLRHASEQADLKFGCASLQSRQFANALEDALFGVITDRAGVEQNHVGIAGALGFGESSFAQDSTYELRVGDIHLASVSLNVDSSPAQAPIRGLVGHQLFVRSHSHLMSLNSLPRFQLRDKWTMLTMLRAGYESGATSIV